MYAKKMILRAILDNLMKFFFNQITMVDDLGDAQNMVELVSVIETRTRQFACILRQDAVACGNDNELFKVKLAK